LNQARQNVTLNRARPWQGTIWWRPVFSIKNLRYRNQ